MLPASLHALRRNGPCPVRQVELRPAGARDFGGSRGGEDAQFQRPGRKAFPASEVSRERRNVLEGQGRVVLHELLGDLPAFQACAVEVVHPAGRVALDNDFAVRVLVPMAAA